VIVFFSIQGVPLSITDAGMVTYDEQYDSLLIKVCEFWRIKYSKLFMRTRDDRLQRLLGVDILGCIADFLHYPITRCLEIKAPFEQGAEIYKEFTQLYNCTVGVQKCNPARLWAGYAYSHCEIYVENRENVA